MKKKENKKRHTPRHRVIHNPITPSLHLCFSNTLHVIKKGTKMQSTCIWKESFCARDLSVAWISEVVRYSVVIATTGRNRIRLLAMCHSIASVIL